MQPFVQQISVFLNQQIPAEPGAFIGPIAVVLGFIIDFIFDVWSFITPAGALGVAIIIMTIIVRTALMPTSFKMVSNSMKMREMKPEMDKIKEKYGNSKDPELRRKMQAEIQALNSKHGVNMLASCLPMLITWPLFMALFVVLSNAFLFVGNVADAYTAVSTALIAQGGEFWSIPEIVSIVQDRIPPQVVAFETRNVENMNRLIHVFSEENWSVIFSFMSANDAANIQGLLNQKDSLMSFLGLNLVAPAGLAWPGIILPVLSAGSMLLSQFLMMKTNPPTDEQALKMQKITMIIFPVMFGAFTIQAPAGVGVYWVMLNVYMIVQHHFIMKYYNNKAAKEAAEGGKGGPKKA